MLTAVPATLLALSLGSAPADVHPQDGPDVDLRIRIDDRAVTWQVTANLAYLDEVVEVPRESLDAIHPAEAGAIHEVVFEHLASVNRCIIDGVEVEALDGGFEVGDPELHLLPLFPLTGMRALLRVRCTFRYECKTPPSSVALTWGEYPTDLVLAQGLDEDEELPTIVIAAQLAAQGIQSEVEFRAEEPEFVWHDTGERIEDRFLEVPAAPPSAGTPIPVASVLAVLLGLGSGLPLLLRGRRGAGVAVLVLAGVAGWTLRDLVTIDSGELLATTADLPDEEEALAIFRPLHANIYRAFDYAEESDVYDALERSVEGALLDTLYGEIYRGLVMQEEGGAVSRVEAVRPLETAVTSIGRLDDDRPGFEVETRWQVDGAVHHWGHSHERTNEYHARYAVVSGERGWRIASHQTLEQRRVEAAALPEPERPGPTLPEGWEDL